MPLIRRLSPMRLGWLAVVTATLAVAGCDSTSSFRPDERLWSFVTVSALKAPDGSHRTAPNGIFFRGSVSSIPNAATRPDSCFPAQTYTPPTNNFAGVTYLDAGASITTTMGGNAVELPRQSASGGLQYGLANSATVAYNPGDSVVITVPGATGGYPAFTARAKTAEALTLLQAINPAPGGTIPLRWSAPQDGNSAVVLSLQYRPANSTTTLEIRCAFADDGTDSIPNRFHEAWSSPNNTTRAVVVTRLRTFLAAVGSDGAFEFISTYAVPTPTP